MWRSVELITQHNTITLLASHIILNGNEEVEEESEDGTVLYAVAVIEVAIAVTTEHHQPPRYCIIIVYINRYM